MVNSEEVTGPQKQNYQSKKLNIMRNNKIVGLTLNGSLKKAGVTFYSKDGQTIMRVAKSRQPERRTREQFIVRQRMRHAVALWRPLKWAGEPLFDGGYGRFLSLMRRVAAVYLTENQHISGMTLLLPGMPVSDGVLPVVEQRLGEVEGTAALLVEPSSLELKPGDKLLLYTVRQTIRFDTPRVEIGRREVETSEWVEAGDMLALVDEGFGDAMTGWALVHVGHGRCSSQGVVTRSTFYRQFTTEEALQAAAASYGGLTEGSR